MTIAVVGAQGFVGRHLVKKLRDELCDVVEFSSRTGNGIDPNSGRFPDGFSFPTRTRAVVYLAQSPFYRHDALKHLDHLYNVNVVSVIRAAMLARQAGATRFIYASTGNVYTPGFKSHAEDSPVSCDELYSLSKLYGEQALDMFRADLDITIVRPFGIYGPRQRDKLVPNLIDSVRVGREVTLSPHTENAIDDGGLRISLCYIDDATTIISRLLFETGIARLNLAGPEPTCIRKIIDCVGKQLGKNPTMRLASTPRRFDLLADVSFLRQQFDIQFTPLEVGLQRTLDHGTRNIAA